MSKRKTHAEFIEQIKDRPFVALTMYEKSSVKMRFQCTVDGNIWEATPNNILSGTGCRICGNNAVSTKNTKENKIISDNGATIEVDVSTKKHKDATMLIEKADYLLIRKTHKGRITAIAPTGSHTKYAVTIDGGTPARIHKLIIVGDIIDHKNGNGLDNRRVNLRSCTSTENRMNSRIRKDNKTGITGVTIDKQSGRYKAQIMINKQRIILGIFSTIEEATKVRREAELKYFGEFAPINIGDRK